MPFRTPINMAIHRLLIAAFVASLGIIGVAREAVAFPASRLAGDTCGSEPTGFIIFVPIDAPGSQGKGLNIANLATGETVTILERSWVGQVAPLGQTGKAVVSTSEDEFVLVEAATGSATKLDIPPEIRRIREWTTGVPLGAGVRYTLLSDGFNAFLLDIEGGAVVDLRTLLPNEASEIPLNPTMSADEKWVLLWDANQQWLLPTDQPSAIRPLSEGSRSNGASFSSDSSAVIYNRRPADGDASRELVIEPVDGSSPPEVLASGKLVSGVFVRGTDLIAFDRVTEGVDDITAEIVLLDRATGDERALLTHEVEPMSLIPSPDGSHLLAGMDVSGSGMHYTDIDLLSGKVTELSVLDGLNLFGTIGSQWRLAMPVAQASEEVPLPGFYSIELNAGSATIMAPLAFDSFTFTNPPSFLTNGTVAFNLYFGTGAHVLWRLDLPSATATVLRDGAPIAGFDLSPDGCWLAIDEYLGQSDIYDSKVVVGRVGFPGSIDLGLGTNPVWVDA